MTAPLILAFIQFLTGQAFEAWKWARQTHGEAIPEWATIMQKFDAQQAKLDAAKDQ
jgi:hypothetical protein